MAWQIIAAAAISAMANRGNKAPRYTPNPEWLKMKEDVMRGVRKGLEEGGYTWSEEVGDQLYRGAMEQSAQHYAGANRRVVESMAPYGNVGAMGRSLSNLNIARAQEESKIGRELDTARETQKLNSYNQLLQMGGSMQDPNLPGAQQDLAAYNAGPKSNIWNALETGASTYLNLTAANTRSEQTDKLLRSIYDIKPIQTPAPAYSTNLKSWPIYDSASSRT